MDNSDGFVAQQYDGQHLQPVSSGFSSFSELLLSDFLTEAIKRIDPVKKDWERWGYIFEKACRLEQDFLTLATVPDNYGPYVDLLAGDGTYTISPYGHEDLFIGVGENGVTLTDTLTKVRDADSSYTATRKLINVQWTFKQSKEGYTIRHATDVKLHLTFSETPENKGPPYYEVKTATDGPAKEWPINVVSALEVDNHGKPTKVAYQ